MTTQQNTHDRTRPVNTPEPPGHLKRLCQTDGYLSRTEWASLINPGQALRIHLNGVEQLLDTSLGMDSVPISVTVG